MNLKLGAALVAVLIAGVGGGYWLAHQKATAAPSSGSSSPADQRERRILYWHDPMVPGQKFDKPGKSPFMDMQLVPVYADNESGGAAVRVSASVAQSLGIRTGKVEKAVLVPRLNIVGSVAFDETSLELVQARIDGTVTRLYVKSPLERVMRGQPLVDILAPQWRAAQEEYISLLDAQTERGQAVRAAARQRLITLGVPDATVRAIERDRITRAVTTLAAPRDGVVTELTAREGMTFMSGAPLFRINALDSVWVTAQVPEAQVSMIPTGATVSAHATAWPGVTFPGRVLAVLPDVDRETRTLSIRIALQNRERKLAPGMFVSLDFAAPPGAAQLAVPSEAVIMTGERSVVIVARADGGFDVAPVTTGTEADGKTAILSGLTEGQDIVLSGQFLLDSEASLKSAVSRLSSASETTGAVVGAAAAAQTAAHLTQGSITAMAPDSITIAHEAVPSLSWPAMTMTFKRPETDEPPDLKVGDRVSFSFVDAGNNEYRISTITRLEPAEQSAPKPERTP
jgi:Cu(I)/Ag(I) efflux system membrane fusion protein